MGDNEDRSGCYLCLLAPLETWPMAPAILTSLTLANDIITLFPEINPNSECSHKKSNIEMVFLTGSHPANTCIVQHIALQRPWVCLEKYEIFMATCYSVVCFHFRFIVLAFAEQQSQSLGLAGRGRGGKAKKKEEGGGLMEERK